MIPSVSDDPQAFASTDQRFPGKDLSWAGEGPRPNVFSFGTTDGSFFCSGQLTQTDIGRPIIIGNDGEAINSAAFNGNLLGVSSRAEIVIIRDLPLLNNGTFNHTIINRGAHEILAMPSGNFIAPIGKDGLLFIEPRERDVASTTAQVFGKSFYNYKVSVLGATPKGECVASALRQDGLSVVIRNGDSWSGSLWVFAKLDIVDVTPIASLEFPFGLAVIGIDNSIHFVRDVFIDRTPRTFRFSGLSGKAYRLLSCDGHIFVLTSKCFYVFRDLASRFLSDTALDAPLTVIEFPCDAIDVNLAFGRDLLLLLPDRLKVINVAQFSNLRSHEFPANWRPELSIEGTYHPLANYTLVPI